MNTKSVEHLQYKNITIALANPVGSKLMIFVFLNDSSVDFVEFFFGLNNSYYFTFVDFKIEIIKFYAHKHSSDHREELIICST